MISDFHLKVDEIGTLLGCPIFKGHEFQYGCPQTSVRNYHHILHNIPEQGKLHVPTFKIIFLHSINKSDEISAHFYQASHPKRQQMSRFSLFTVTGK
jgi:hypothetical protein